MIVMEPRSLLHRSSLGLLVVVLIITSNGCCVAWFTGNTDINKKLTNIASKVDAIDTKLTSGQDQHSLLTKIDKKLKNLDIKMDDLARIITRGPIYSRERIHFEEFGPNKEKEDSFYYNCVNLISVERYPVKDGNRFTVKFTKNTEDVFFHLQDLLYRSKITESIEEGDNGVWSVSFTYPVFTRPKRRTWMSIKDSVDLEDSYLYSRNAVSLELDNSDFTPSFQLMGDLPEIHVYPSRAIVYEPGQDFNVAFFVPFSNLRWHDCYLFKSFHGINVTSGKASIYNSELLHELKKPNTELIKEGRSLTVLTSSSTVSGFLLFSFGVEIRGPLVKDIQVFRTITVRPSNQSGVLPAGFFDFFHRPYLRLSQNGKEVYKCEAGRKCTITCLVVGDSITDIEVLKVLPGGRKEAVPSATSNDLDFKHLKGIEWEFQAEEDSGDDKGITTFQCSASDMSRGKEISKFIDVLVVVYPGIDEESSSITVRDDPVHSNIKILTLICVFYGRPLPEVGFVSGTSPIFSFNSSEPDNIVNTGKSRAVATKTVTVDLDDTSDGYGFYENDLEPNCQFYSRHQEEYVMHFFEFPDIGLHRKGDREFM